MTISATPTRPVAREPRVFVADLPAEHLEELDFLWMQAQLASAVPGATMAYLQGLRERMRANALGLEVAGRRALPLLEEALADKSPSLAAAAAHALLRANDSAGVARVTAALEAGPAGARQGVREALVFGPAQAALAKLRELAASDVAEVAVATAEVLAAHGTTAAPRALGAWLSHEDAAVRRGACRVAAWSNAESAALERIARDDADALVRREALHAGAWQRAPWVLTYGRACAAARNASRPEAIALWCALAGSADAELVKAVAGEAALTPARFEYAASWGRPAVFEWLLAALAGKDAKDAEAAGAAFVRMAGKSLPTSRTGDAAEGEDEALLVDAVRAQALWREKRAVWEKGRRWAGGFDVGASLDAVASLDLASRYETLLRGRYRNEWSGGLRELLLLS